MIGKIIKGIGGFYYINTGDGALYEARGRGLLRKRSVKPLVGDNAEFDIIDEAKKTAVLVDILDRKNELIRPASANIDQALIVFAIKEPDPDFALLDRYLIYMGTQGIPVIICFNKADLDNEGLCEKYKKAYEAAGYKVIYGSVKEDTLDSEIHELLKGRTTILAGPSGAGKSSLTNRLHMSDAMEVGELSEKIKRGKQTTRHTEIFCLENGTYILDTPGFTALTLEKPGANELRFYYSEFSQYEQDCRFSGCRHMNEKYDICGVKQAVKAGLIDRTRYENYRKIYNELKDLSWGLHA